MNGTRLFLICALLAMAGSALADGLRIAGITMEPGETKEVAVELQNPDYAYIMTEFWLSLPEGVSIATDVDGELLCTPNDARFDRTHQLVVSQEESGDYHFLIYSSRNKALKESSGTLFTMTLQAAANAPVTTGRGRIYSQLFADTNKEEHHPEEITFDISIASGITINLTKGWNWISTCMQEALPMDELKAHCTRIVGQDQELIRDPQFGMTGGLATLDADKGYKVLVDEAFTLTLAGEPAENPVALKKGWNWIAGRCTENTAIGNAVSNAEAGDRIVSMTASAQFDGSSWSGTLDTLKPGEGYLYLSVSDKQLVYVKP